MLKKLKPMVLVFLLAATMFAVASGDLFVFTATA